MLDGPGAAAGVGQGAVVVLDAATGAVRVMVGGRDYRDSNFNRAVNAHRQPGSAFKPFVWLMALENGMTPADMVLDAPVRIGNWQPEDFEHEYRGEITLDEALAQSINTVSVRLLTRFGGPKPVAATAAATGDHQQVAQQRLIGTGHRRGRVAGTDRRLRPVLQRRLSRRAVRGRTAGGAGVGDPAGACGDDGGNDGFGCLARHRPGRGCSWASGRGKNRDDIGLSRCVVHWVRERNADRGVDGE